MAALTPARPALRRSHEHRLFPHRSPCFTPMAFRSIPSPTTPCAHHRFCTLPLSDERFPLHDGSGLRLWLADSPPIRPNRVRHPTDRSHLLLRTPPPGDALIWLQAGERMPEEDLHLSDHVRLQAHECGFRRITGCHSDVKRCECSPTTLPLILLSSHSLQNCWRVFFRR